MAVQEVFFDAQKKDISKFIEHALNYNIKQDDKNIEFDKLFIKKDLVSMEILKLYNKKTGTNLQDSLIGILTPMVIGKVEKTTSKTTRKTDLISPKKDENKEQIVLENNIKNELLKATYESVLDEYNSLRETLYTGVNGQTKTGEISVGDKMSTKLVLYESYLKKINMQYKSSTGKFIIQDDEKIQEKEEKYKQKQSQNQEIVNEKSIKNNQKIELLNEKIDEIMDEMLTTSENAHLYSQQEYDTKMNNLKEFYTKSFCELKYLEIDNADIYEQTIQANEYEEFREKKVGSYYEEQKAKEVDLDKDVARYEDKTKSIQEENLEVTKQNIEDTSGNMQELENAPVDNEFKEELKEDVYPLDDQIDNYKTRIEAKESEELNNKEKQIENEKTI